MRNGLSKRPFLAVVITMLFWCQAAGQTGTSRVTGLVQDINGAIVPGAAVTLTNEGTNATFKGSTTSA
ncbi:MAG: hypothetical protein AB7H86_21915, partial [Blastocatellales bacterium]